MKKLNLFLPVILLTWVTGTSAHGPVRQKLKESIKIDAVPAKVWQQLENFSSASWLPMVDSVKATGGNEIGATRTLTLKSGSVISEALKKYNVKKMSYSYKIIDMSILKTIRHAGVDEPIKVLPVTDYAASITVKESGKGSEVTWKAAYYRGYMNNNPPKELNEEAARQAIQLVFQAGLKNLKALAESNQPVASTKKITRQPQKAKPSTSKNATTDFDPNYPAANFQPKVIFSDPSAITKSVKLTKSMFDPKYPASNFEPKVIYP